MENRKTSFWDRLTGSVSMEEQESHEEKRRVPIKEDKGAKNWMEEESAEAELAVDVYQTPTDIIVQTMVAGVRPEDLELSVARDIITIVGKREEGRNIDDDNYFAKELYWGKFSRTI